MSRLWFVYGCWDITVCTALALRPVLFSLLSLTHSFDLPRLTPRTQTACHEYSSVCLPKSYSLIVYSVTFKTEFVEDPVCVCVRLCARVCARVCSQFHAFLRMSRSDSISRKRTVVLRPRISQLLLVCVYACVHIGACVHLSVFMCVCKWVDTLSQKIIGAECFFSQCSASSSSECPLPWFLSVCACVRVCSCVHFYDLKQILLAMIFLCG